LSSHIHKTKDITGYEHWLFHILQKLKKSFNIHFDIITNEKYKDRQKLVTSIFDNFYYFSSNNPFYYNFLYPHWINEYKNKYFTEMISKITSTNKYDLIHLHLLGNIINLPRHLDIPVLIDAVDADSLFYYNKIKPEPSVKRKMIFLFEFFRTLALEYIVYHKYKKIVVVSKFDQEYLEKYNKIKISCVPLGVDSEFFSKYLRRKRNKNLICFFGNMTYSVNYDSIKYFVENIFPALVQKRPDLKFQIIGRGADQFKAKNVQTINWVKDLRPYVSKAYLTITPMISGVGMKNKILESMAIGTPVITTPIGYHGLNMIPNKEIIIANNDELVSKTLELLDDRKTWWSLKLNGYKKVQKSYSWEISSKSIYNLYNTILRDNSYDDSDSWSIIRKYKSPNHHTQ
jgi:glycosyltransferase involved in cell wall biosynthesis